MLIYTQMSASKLTMNWFLDAAVHENCWLFLQIPMDLCLSYLHVLSLFTFLEKDFKNIDAHSNANVLFRNDLNSFSMLQSIITVDCFFKSQWTRIYYISMDFICLHLRKRLQELSRSFIRKRLLQNWLEWFLDDSIEGKPLNVASGA